MLPQNPSRFAFVGTVSQDEVLNATAPLGRIADVLVIDTQFGSGSSALNYTLLQELVRVHGIGLMVGEQTWNSAGAQQVAYDDAVYLTINRILAPMGRLGPTAPPTVHTCLPLPRAHRCSVQLGLPCFDAINCFLRRLAPMLVSC